MTAFFTALNHPRLLAHSCAGQKSVPSVTGFHAQDLTGCDGGGLAVSLSGGSPQESLPDTPMLSAEFSNRLLED